ncbi:hypothetical protein BSR47_01785 [Bradyrhizobium canariense]|nr:hypothetical protein BSR47_01785 [Bradyrhizobium canariense]
MLCIRIALASTQNLLDLRQSFANPVWIATDALPPVIDQLVMFLIRIHEHAILALHQTKGHVRGRHRDSSLKSPIDQRLFI